MAQRKYELASAYVRIMPSLDGIADALSKELGKALNKGVNEAPIENTVGEKLSKAVQGAKLGDIGKQIFSGATTILAPLNSALTSTVRGAGQLFADTLAVSARTAGAALTAAIGAVGGQIAAGGLNRALGINEATAGLKAMSFEGEQFTKIMQAASNAVDGTAYSMDQSVLAARNFLAAGIPEEKLQSYLENVGRLADMGTRSYDEISTILQSMAATGIIQGGDMLQLAQAGIPIFSALSDSLGVSVAEVKKLGSEGKITFDDLNTAVGSINWDAAVFAATDVRSAFGNVRAQLSKIGANLWTPIIDKLPGILGNLRSFISIFGKTFDFNPIQTKLSASMDRIASVFDRFKDVDGALNADKVKEYVNSVLGNFKNLSAKLDDYKGVIVGAVIGISGSFLAGIPVIGPIFAGLTPLVGAFAGVLVTAFQNSERLQGAIGGLKGIWTTIGDRLFNDESFKGKDFFQTIGDSLATSIEWIQELVLDFIDELADNMPAIKETVGGMFKSIGDAFKAAGDSGFDGEAIAGIFVKIVDIFSTYAPLAFKVILEAGAMVARVVESPIFTTLVGWLTDAFTAFTDNEQVIQAGLTAAAAIFIGSKLTGVIGGITSFFGSLKTMGKASKGAPAAAAATATGLSGALSGLGTIIGVVTAIISVLAIVGAIDHIFGGNLAAFINNGIIIIMTGINLIVNGLTMAIDTILPVLDSLLYIVVNAVVNLIEGIISAVLEPLGRFIDVVGTVVTAIVDSSAGLVNALSGLAVAGSIFLNTVSHLLDTLAENGQAAGEGAWAAAGGIGALMAAIAGGTLANGGANFIQDALNGLTGQKGENPLDQLIRVIDGVTKLSAIAATFPAVFNASLAAAMAFGTRVPYSIAEGISLGAPAIAIALTSAILMALSTQQAILDANPLTVRLKVDDTALRAIGAGSAATATPVGVSSRTNNYNLTTSNDALIKRIVKSGRGY